MPALKPVKRYYVATDLLIRSGNEYIWDKKQQSRLDLMFQKFEHYYWNTDKETWYGDVLRATLYQSAEEAESAAFVAVVRDPNTAGHAHVVSEKDALAREKSRIRAREEVKNGSARVAWGHRQGYQLPLSGTPPPEH